MIKEPLQSGISQMPTYNNLSYSGPEGNPFEMQTKKKGAMGKRGGFVHVGSLQDLISKLYTEFEKDRVDVDYICDVMKAYKSVPQEWKKYAKFDRYRYTRNLVDSGNGKFNLMILCWGEGHGSAIHDHADAHCFMKVLEGTLSEVRFAYPDDSSATVDVENAKLRETGRADLKLNEVCYINGGYYWTIWNLKGQPKPAFILPSLRGSLMVPPKWYPCIMPIKPCSYTALNSLGLHRVENPSHVNPAVSLHLYCPPFDTCSVFNQQTGQRTKCKVTFWSKYGEARDRGAPQREPEDN